MAPSHWLVATVMWLFHQYFVPKFVFRPKRVGPRSIPQSSDSTPSSRLWCIPKQCAAFPFLSGLSPLHSPLLNDPGVHAGVLGFNPMLLPKLDRREIPRSRDRGKSYISNSGSPSIRGSGSCLRLCRVVSACFTPTGGSRSTPAGAGQREL